MTLRKAAMRDIPAILDLINSYATQGVMLPRSDFELSESIRDFTVAANESEIVGCAALHFYTPYTAEVRSLAVLPSAKGRGIGRRLVGELEREARDCELASIFAFTYVPGFFQQLGFAEVDRGLLPLKAWKECLRCPKFQCCDEIAVLKELQPERVPAAGVLKNSTLRVMPDRVGPTLPSLPNK
jgi:amino-acid N-acetyltransferase